MNIYTTCVTQLQQRYIDFKKFVFDSGFLETVLILIFPRTYLYMWRRQETS